MSTTLAGKQAIVPLHDSVRALCNPYAVDGRVSWHAPEARGFAPSNCYLVSEPGEALLVDCGLTVHARSVLAQLRELRRDGQALATVVLRQGEFDSICNFWPIAEELGLTRAYGQFDDVPGWADVAPAPRGATGRGARPRAVPTTVVRRTDTLSVGGVPRLHATQPSLRLLNTFWLYDEASRCLFTSDAFSHVHRRDPDGPWTVTAADDETTYEDVARHMLATRYWWIPSADVRQLRSDLAHVFERWPVETLAPAWGCILHGADVVARHRELVDAVLRREGRVA